MKKICSIVLIFLVAFGTFTTAYAKSENEITFAYALTDEERILAEEIVMAEASTDFYGQALIAECMLNTAALNGWSIQEVIDNYGWTQSRVDPSESAIWAIKSVFDYGYRPSGGELITVFYNPSMVNSDYHESQELVLEHRSVRFFRETRFNKLKEGGTNGLNNKRRTEIAQTEIMLNEVQRKISDLSFAENEAFNNLSDGLQASERGVSIELAAEHLDAANDYIDMALEELELAKNGE